MTAPAEPTEASPAAPSRRSSRKTLLLGVGLVVGLLVVVAIVASRSQPEMPPVVQSGQEANELPARVKADKRFALPPATLDGFAGGPDVNLADFRGKPLVVNFWATWCAPCVKEMPELAEAERLFGNKVALLGIDVEDAPPNAEPFVKRLGITYPMALDADRSFFLEVGNVGMPTTLLVDGDGIVRYRYTGPLDVAKLRSLVKQYLGVTLKRA